MRVMFVCQYNEFGQVVRVETIKKQLLKNGVTLKEFNFNLEYNAENKKIRFLRHIVDNRLFVDYDENISFVENFNIDDMVTYRKRVFQKKLMKMNLDFYKDCDIIHAENHEGALVALILKEMLNKPYVFDMHGLSYEERKGIGGKKRDILYERRMEKLLVKNADYICVVSQYMKNYVNSEYAFPLNRIFVVPCSGKVYNEKATFSLNLNVIYAGGIGYWESVDDYVNTPFNYYDKYNDSNEKFFFLGGMNDNLLKKLNSIKYLGKLNRYETLKTLKNMQVGIAPSTKDKTRMAASPLKIIDYASVGLPVVTCNVGEWSDYIKDFDAGIVCENSDPREFSEALHELKDKEVWNRKSKNAVNMVNELYDDDIVLSQLVRFYKD